LSDIRINAEDLSEYSLYPAKTIPAKVSFIKQLTKDVVKVSFRTPPNNRLNFIPGQYIDLIFGNIRRSYSIANKPRDDGSIDLIIKKVFDGEMSNKIFNETSVNELYRFEGPLGTFGFRNVDKKNIIFLATGTGIAPVISMLQQIQTTNKNIILIWGNRYVDDFFDISLDFENIFFIKVLSREISEGYQSGYVQDVLLSQNINLSESIVYACGSDTMIKTNRKLLIEKGLDNDAYYSDSFVSSGD